MKTATKTPKIAQMEKAWGKAKDEAVAAQTIQVDQPGATTGRSDASIVIAKITSPVNVQNHQ